MSAVLIENSAINVFPNCKCVCNPCPIKAEPAQTGSSCWPSKKQSSKNSGQSSAKDSGSSCWSSKEPSGKHNGRSSAKDSGSSCWPSNKSGDHSRQTKKQGWSQWLYWRPGTKK